MVTMTCLGTEHCGTQHNHDDDDDDEIAYFCVRRKTRKLV